MSGGETITNTLGMVEFIVGTESPWGVLYLTVEGEPLKYQVSYRTPITVNGVKTEWHDWLAWLSRQTKTVTVTLDVHPNNYVRVQSADFTTAPS